MTWTWPMRLLYRVSSGLAGIVIVLGLAAVASVLFILFIWSMEIILEGP